MCYLGNPGPLLAETLLWQVCKRVLMQGIRAPAPRRLFPITMTASGLSPDGENGQPLPREQRELIIKAGLDEKVASLIAGFWPGLFPLWCWRLDLGFHARPVLGAQPELYPQPFTLGVIEKLSVQSFIVGDFVHVGCLVPSLP